MSELSVGSLSGLAANSYVIDVASGSSLDLSAGAVLPAGSVLQVVQAAKTNTFFTASTSFVDITGLVVSITPSSTSSKILITADVNFGIDSVSADRNAFLRLAGGNSSNYIGDASGSRVRAATGFSHSSQVSAQYHQQTATMVYLDSPATTSEVTYSVQGLINNATGAALRVNYMGLDADSNANGRFASSITLMEIAG